MAMIKPTVTSRVPKLSPLEQLRENRARKDNDSILFNLNVIWGSRLVFDLLLVIPAILLLVGVIDQDSSDQEFEWVFISVFLALESVFILAFFYRKKWCKTALNLFSAVSLLNYPIGTFFSVYHYFNIGKKEFKE